MAKFLFIYRGNSMERDAMTPEQMQASMDKWTTWIGAAMQQGWMISPGDALMPDGRVVKPKVVTDGPFVEAKEVVGGFSIIQADSIDAAAKLAQGCPGLLTGGSVEVRPLAGYADSM